MPVLNVNTAPLGLVTTKIAVSGCPAALIFSRLNLINGVPARTSSPSLTRYSKPSPFIATVSSPTWIKISAPFESVMPTACLEASISTVILPETGAQTVSFDGLIAKPSPTIPSEKTPSLTALSVITSPSRYALISCSLSTVGEDAATGAGALSVSAAASSAETLSTPLRLPTMTVNIKGTTIATSIASANVGMD